MWARFRSLMAASLLRQAEADLARHRAEGHRVRAFFLERKVERMRGETGRRSRTGDRVVTYLELGMRAR